WKVEDGAIIGGQVPGTVLGAYLMSDSCPALGRVHPEGVRVAATDSCKQAHYLPATLGFDTWFGSVEDCVDAAVTGRWSATLQ
ncbi:MAG: aconitase X, partial [Pseudomonadota bacterium]